jgi:hypothetical protein
MVTLLSMFVASGVTFLVAYRAGYKRGYDRGKASGFREGKSMGGHRDHS